MSRNTTLPINAIVARHEHLAEGRRLIEMLRDAEREQRRVIDAEAAFERDDRKAWRAARIADDDADRPCPISLAARDVQQVRYELHAFILGVHDVEGLDTLDDGSDPAFSFEGRRAFAVRLDGMLLIAAEAWGQNSGELVVVPATEFIDLDRGKAAR